MKKVTGLQTFIEAQTSGKARAFTFCLKKMKVTQDRKKIWKNSYYQLVEAQQKIVFKCTKPKKKTQKRMCSKFALLTSILGNWWVKQFIASAPLVLAVCLFYRT